MNISLRNQWAELQQKAMQAWDAKLAPRYQALDEREQRVVRIAAIALPLILIVFGIMLPAADKNTQLQQELSKIARQAHEANLLADALASAPKQSRGSPQGNTLTQVDKIARATGVRSFITRLRPQQTIGGGSRLQTQVKEAPYDKVVLFLSALEKNRLTISQLNIQSTEEVGLVNLQAVIGN